MQLFMRMPATICLLIITGTALGYFYWHKPAVKISKPSNPSSYKNNHTNAAILARLKTKAIAIKQYAKLNKYNSTYCFMADMHMASGEKRFFIYNLVKDSIELAGMVAHGCGRHVVPSGIEFSNEANSLCTSLGKYKIGNAYTGKFGLAFKLFGLDKTNSNAYNRAVVLHAHSCVPNAETAPLPICESWGCPTVSTSFLVELKQYIDKSEKPLLLDIYY